MERVFIQSTGKGVNGHRRPCGDTRHRVSDKRSRIQNITTSQKEKTILTGKKKKANYLNRDVTKDGVQLPIQKRYLSS